MIKTARKKFIITTMTILLVVFVLISSISYAIISYIFNFNVRKNLEDVITSYELSKDTTTFIPVQGILIPLIKDGSVLSIPHFDSKYYTEEQAKEIIDKALKNNNMNGNVGNIYYMFANSSGDYLIFVASDMTETVQVRTRMRINLLACTCLTYLILLLIVLKISENVFKPIKENLEKQRQFLADASHELKTPLTIISANTEVLAENGENQWVDNIKSQTQRMQVLVNDMLTLTKINDNSNVISSETFDISQEVLDAVLPFDALAFENKKTIITEISPNLSYIGDRQGVNKLINILLDNAIKHGTENGIILVSLVKNNSNLILTVKNDGSEVKNEDSNKIFERFYRVESSRSREKGGSGLGLAIAKNICEKNKWKIFAISNYHHSMQISVVL